MLARTAGALDRLFKSSRFQADDDLVFAHPELGSVLERPSCASDSRPRSRPPESGRCASTTAPHIRHTGAASGMPLRTLQEWMGHRDYKTTLIYVDYAPRAEEPQMMERAFARGN
jgi:integrase